MMQSCIYNFFVTLFLTMCIFFFCAHTRPFGKSSDNSKYYKDVSVRLRVQSTVTANFYFIYLSIIRHSKNLLTYQWCNHIFWNFSSFSHYMHYFFCTHRPVSETFGHNQVDVQTTKPQICMYIICTTSKKTILDTWVHYWYVNKFLECLIIDKQIK